MNDKERNLILLNGALISLGTVAILDNVFSHWLFKWHQILPDRERSLFLEAGLFAAGVIMLILGLYREIKARQNKRKTH